MPRELRLSSLYEVTPPPKGLRRLEIIGFTAQVVAIVLMWCRIALAISWPNRVWYDVAVVLMLATNLVVQIYVVRWNRKRKEA
jgi:hypothetical protein